MDFMGITYKGRHSSEFGLTRVSNGDRYQDILVPNAEIYTSDIPGGDGVYYFGKNLRSRVIPLEFAFDDITETQIRQIKQWVNGEGLGDLIFDELPYKRYVCGVSNSPEFNYICFDILDEITGKYRRSYKGEVSIEFTAYYPYAFNNYGKSLEDYRKNAKLGSKNIVDTNAHIFGTTETGATTVNLDNDKVYKIAQIEGIKPQKIKQNYNPTDVNAEDQMEYAFQKGYNIWNKIVNETEISPNITASSETMVLSGKDLIKFLYFNGLGKDGQQLRKTQHYYLSCDITLDKDYIFLGGDHTSQNAPIGHDPEKINQIDDGAVYFLPFYREWDSLMGRGKNPFVPKMGLYIKRISDNTYFPLLTWDTISKTEGSKVMGNATHPNSYTWEKGSFMYDFLTGKTKTIQCDSSKLIDLNAKLSTTPNSFPDLFYIDNGMYNPIPTNYANGRIMTKEIFDDYDIQGKHNFITATKQDYMVNYELVAFGVPYHYGTAAEIDSYKPVTISNIKIVEKLEKSSKSNEYVNIMDNNNIYPYMGGHNFTYYKPYNSNDNSIVNWPFEIRLVNWESDYNYNKNIKGVSNYAYTSNILAISEDFNYYNDVTAVRYNNGDQTFTFLPNFTSGHLATINYAIPPELYTLIENNGFLVFSLEDSLGNSSETELQAKLPLSEDFINIENNSVSTVKLPRTGEIKIQIKSGSSLKEEVKLKVGYYVNEPDKGFAQIGYSKLELNPTSFKTPNGYTYYYNNGLVDFINNSFKKNVKSDLFDFNISEYNILDNFIYIKIPIEDMVLNPTMINSNYCIYKGKISNISDLNEKNLHHGDFYSILENGIINIVLILKYFSNEFENISTYIDKIIKLHKNTYIDAVNTVQPQISYVSRYNKAIEIPIQELPNINSNYCYFVSRSPSSFHLSYQAIEDNNIEEWAASSNLPDFNEDIIIADNLVSLPNYGDIENGFTIKLKKEIGEDFKFTLQELFTAKKFTINFDSSNFDINSEEYKKIYLKSGAIEINTNNKTIIFVAEDNDTVKIPIYFTLIEGNFFKLKPGSNVVLLDGNFLGYSTTNNNAIDRIDSIEYDYLYY